MNTNNQIYYLTSLIPQGRVTTYGRLAKLAGIKSPRQVGRILHLNPNPTVIPCHRVVNFEGRPAQSYAFGGAISQLKKLRQEGIVIKNNRVDLSRYLWHSPKL